MTTTTTAVTPRGHHISKAIQMETGHGVSRIKIRFQTGYMPSFKKTQKNHFKWRIKQHETKSLLRSNA